MKKQPDSEALPQESPGHRFVGLEECSVRTETRRETRRDAFGCLALEMPELLLSEAAAGFDRHWTVPVAVPFFRCVCPLALGSGPWALGSGPGDSVACLLLSPGDKVSPCYPHSTT